MTKLSKRAERRLAVESGFKKTCTRCEHYKPFSEYHNDRSAKDGKCTMCKPCRLKSVAKSRATRKGKTNFNTIFDIKTELVNFKQNLVVELNKSHQHTREYVDSSCRLERLRREASEKKLIKWSEKAWFWSGFTGVLIANLIIVIIKFFI